MQWISVSDGQVGWAVYILLNMAVVNNLNLKNLNNLTIADVAKYHVEFFGHCIIVFATFWEKHYLIENILLRKTLRFTK